VACFMIEDLHLLLIFLYSVLLDEKSNKSFCKRVFERMILFWISTRCIEKEVWKVPIFEDGPFKYLRFTSTTTTTTPATTSHFRKIWCIKWYFNVRSTGFILQHFNRHTTFSVTNTLIRDVCQLSSVEISASTFV